MPKPIMPASEYREIRKRLKLSHAMMAETFGFNPRTSRRYEIGEHEPPHTLRKLMRLVSIVRTKPKAVAKLTIAAAVALVIGNTPPAQAVDQYGFPECDDVQIVQMLRDAIANSGAGRLGVQVLTVDRAYTTGYALAEQLTAGPRIIEAVANPMQRRCSAMAMTSTGLRPVEYSYQWVNAGNLMMRARLSPP